MNTSMEMDMDLDLPTCPEKFKENLTKYRAIVYHFDGVTTSRIAKLLSKPKGTISKWISKFLEVGEVISEKEKSGRPKKITSEIEEQIEIYLKDDPTMSQNDLSEKIYKEMNINIARQTISDFLKTKGKYQLQQPIPILSLKNQQKRLDYALFHKNDKFSNVIFSDESRFQLCTNTQRVFFLKIQKDLNNQCQIQTIQS